MVLVNQFFAKIISRYSPSIFYIIAYFNHRHSIPNFKNPKNISEIWINKVLSGYFLNLFHLADKYAVRKYVEDKGLGYLLTPLIACYDTANEFSLEELPDKFAMKANWGAGMNLICSDKKLLKEDEARETIKKWLGASEYFSSEDHYNLIDRKIVVEEFIDDGKGGFPVDYKFICFKGVPYCVLVCSGRETGHADYIPYSMDFKPLFDYCIQKHDEAEIMPKPDNFDDMVNIAKELSSDIDLVRIDLYSNGSKVWFGEITLTPDGCIFRRWSKKAINEMGEFYRNL